MKEIDDLPRVNATAPIMCERVDRFLTQIPQYYYEPVRDLDGLLNQMAEVVRLRKAGAPEYTQHKFLLVFEAFSSAHSSPTGRIVFPTVGDDSLGLHAVVPEDIESDGTTLRFWNSWGTSWGENGYGTISRDYLEQYFSSATTSWNARWGSHPGKVYPVSSLSDTKELKRIWTNENPIHKNRIYSLGGDRWMYEQSSTVSELQQSIVNIITIRNEYGLRMGWAHVAHVAHSDTSRILELFVMPAFRGQGIGSVLEGMCTQSALIADSIRIELVLHEADAIVGGPLSSRRHARNFARQRGYTMRWRHDPALHYAAVGVKLVSEDSVRGA